MALKRRTFLKHTVAASAVAAAAAAGLLVPRAVLAAWPKNAFDADNVDGALSNLHGSAASAGSGDIDIKAPDIAENGAVVPVTVSTSLGGVESISIIASKNNQPLTSNFVLADGTDSFVSTRIKMAQTSDVIAVVKADGQLYSANKEVKVTIGGCGG